MNCDDLIDIHDVEHEQPENTVIKIIVKNDKNQKIKVRRRQLFDSLNDYKLSYVKGGICDSYIKFGTPPLDRVISDVREMTDQENIRLNKLLKVISKKNVTFDMNIDYFREYIEQDTNFSTAVREGIKEWFYLNMTNYPKYLSKNKNEDVARKKALNDYIEKNGYDEQLKKYLNMNVPSTKISIH